MLTASRFLDTPADRLTPAVEQAFFTSIMTGNRTYKTTFHRRFVEINRYICAELAAGRLDIHHVLDVGISSGISTLELSEDLASCGRRVDIVGTDLSLFANLVSVYPGCKVLLDDAGFPLQLEAFDAGISPWVRGSDYRSGFFVVRKALNVLLTSRARRLVSSGSNRVRRVALVTPRLANRAGITTCVDDIGRRNAAFIGKFDLIRAANILNRAYFPEAVLRSMLANITDYFADGGGTLLVVRTHTDNTNHGTLFRLDGDRRFKIVTRFGNGSEVEPLVVQP